MKNSLDMVDFYKKLTQIAMEKEIRNMSLKLGNLLKT